METTMTRLQRAYEYGIGYARDCAEQVSHRDEILSELPVEFPTRVELVINASAARKMGLSVPSSVLARADEVIR